LGGQIGLLKGIGGREYQTSQEAEIGKEVGLFWLGGIIRKGGPP